jgi:hypothetical protein
LFFPWEEGESFSDMSNDVGVLFVVRVQTFDDDYVPSVNIVFEVFLNFLLPGVSSCDDSSLAIKKILVNLHEAYT